MSDFKVYIASLAAYNNGQLTGFWLDLSEYSDGSAVQEVITEWLEELTESTGELHEEWAVHDYDGDFPSHLTDTEYPDFNQLIKYAELYEEHGEAFKVFLEWSDISDSDKWEDKFNNAYCGEFRSLEEYAEQLVDDGIFGEIPEAIRYHIDYASIARDLELGGDNYFDSGFVFNCNY